MSAQTQCEQCEQCGGVVDRTEEGARFCSTCVFFITESRRQWVIW